MQCALAQNQSNAVNEIEQPKHLPVMLDQAVDLLNIRQGRTYVDATAGAGGHLQAILDRLGGSGRIVGIDQDIHSLQSLEDRLKQRPNLNLVHANFEQLESVLHQCGINTVDGGILADLGVSSMQLDNPERGFSFLQDGPLDMRMDPTQSLTAEELVNELPEKRLADIIYQYGEERESRRIARYIVQSRPLRTTLELANVVSRALGRSHGGGYGSSRKSKSGRVDTSHPATRTFQALRIAVNTELESLEKFLQASIRLMSSGSRLVVITFHSLEDRLVKQILRESAVDCVCPPRQPVCTCHHKKEMLIINRKPIIAAEKEVLANVRSRSAKLRAGEKL